MPEHLGLDEALVSVNKSSIAEQLEVYYQIDECFGCPLEKFTTLAENLENFVIGTKYKLQLELRNINNGSSVCRFNDLALNNHGHYKIDVTNNTNGNLNCLIQKIENGDCSLCPIAMLLCFIILVTVGEKLYAKFVARGAKREDHNDGKLATVSKRRSIGEHEEEQQDEMENEQQVAAVEQLNEVIVTGEGSTMATNPKTATNQGCRIDSLDAFRGLTIIGMILVNYGGAGYSSLEHKPWNGITLADLVFPFFIFSMGASIAISSHIMVKRGKSYYEILLKIFRRSFLLMALGLCLNSKWLNGRGLNELRLTGVLQRFSISYLIVALIYTSEITISKWIEVQGFYRIPILSNIMGALFELLAAIEYLALYLYVTFYFAYNDNCPIGYVGPGGQTDGGRYANCTGGAAAWLDRLVLGESHLYNDILVKKIFKTHVSHDPEGILGYTTSTLLTLIGLQCGKILMRFRDHKTRLFMFSRWIVILALACVLVIVIPINKRLWSLTFVTLSGVCAYLTIALLYFLLDVYNCKRTFFLRLILSSGKNAIFLYVGHSLLDGMLPWYFAVDASSHLQLLLRLSWATFIWLLVAHYMAIKRLFIRI